MDWFGRVLAFLLLGVLTLAGVMLFVVIAASVILFPVFIP